MHVRAGWRALAGCLLVAALSGCNGHQDGEPTAEDPRACAAEQALQRAGRLTIAVAPRPVEPWSVGEPADGAGFESALALALAEALGFGPDRVVWARAPLEAVVSPGAKPFDLAIQQVLAIPDRAEVVALSTEYYRPDLAVLALPGSPVSEATERADLLAVRWGATDRAADLSYLRDRLDPPRLQVYPDRASTFRALLAAEIDATVLPRTAALHATREQVPEAVITAVLPPDPEQPGYAVALELGNSLVACVDAALDRLRAQGTLDALIADHLAVGEEVVAITP